MGFALSSRTLAAAAALALATACGAPTALPDGDYTSADGTSQGKALTAHNPIAPTMPVTMTKRKLMRPKSALTGSFPANAKLANFGGNIIENPTYTNVFWGAYWTSGTGLTERNYMNSFAQTVLPTSEFLSAMVEYTGPAGKTIKAGKYAGEKAISGEPGGTTKKITNDQIRTAIDSWIAAGLVPAPSVDVVYSIHFPPGVTISLDADSSCAQFCGYHNTVTTTRGTGGLIRYIVLPYPSCAGCNFESAAKDSLTVVYSHEAWEAATDPDVGLAIDTNLDKYLGWYDNNNGENADICAGDANATLKNFRVQTTWSNAENKCVSQRSVVTPSPDFTLTPTPASQTVTAGGSTSYSVAVAGTNGFAGAVTFSLSGAPSGVTGSFSGSVAGSGTATLNVATTTAAAGATSTLTITAVSGAITHTASVSLVVHAVAQPDFSFTTSTPSVSVEGGKTATATVTTAALNGFASGVTLTTAGLPSGVTAAFNPATITGSGSSTLTFTAAAAAPTSTGDVTVTATAGAISHNVTVALAVTKAVVPEFSLSVSPASSSVDAGSGTTATVTVGTSGGFADGISLSSTGAPAGVTVTFDHGVLTGAGSAQIGIATTSAAAAGTYTLTITGTSGLLHHSATYALTVVAHPSTSGVVFSDDGESGMGKWVTASQNKGDPQWSIEQSAASKSGQHRFRSNVGRNYASNTATFLISKSFSLAGASKATLSFFYKFQTEDGYDLFYVWASGDDGKTWSTIAEGTGTSQGWNKWAPQAILDLSRFAGKGAVRIAFSLQSDATVTDWGVGLDDIKVTTGDAVVAGN